MKKNRLSIFIDQTYRTFIFCMINALFVFQLSAQTITVKGVVSVSTTSVANALVTFVDQSDTTRKYAAITDSSGNYQVDIVTSMNYDGINLPTKFELSQNYPNPFSTTTSIPYKLHQKSDVQITVYDILGRLVRKFTTPDQSVGTHNILWQGVDDAGKQLAAGIYFYQINTGGENQIKKMIMCPGMETGSGNIQPANFSSFPKSELEMPIKIAGGNFNVRIDNTNNTFPMILTQTFENQEIQDNTTLDFTVSSKYPIANSNIDLNDTRQLIRGFGAANILQWRPDMTSDQVNKAFGTGDGQIGFSILRLRIPYDLSEYAMSIQIPTAKLAQSLGAIVFASPWTPPASMKTNNNIVGGELKESSYAAYAEHLNTFAGYMSDHGAPLYAISLQNEPDISVTYESCDWTPAQMVKFLQENGPSIGTRIIAPESFQFLRPISDAILNDSAACANLDIVGGHIYGGGIGPYPLAEEKGKEIWMTEHLDLDTTWTGNFGTGMEIHNCMNAGMNAYIWWYLVRFYGPVGEDGKVTKRGYVMSQFARFIRPGYYRVYCHPTPQRNIFVSSYKENDSRVSIAAINNSSAPIYQTFTLINSNVNAVQPYTTTKSKSCVAGDALKVTDAKFTVLLEPSSITTYVSE